MGEYSEEVLDACSMFGYSCTFLDTEQVQLLHIAIQKKFAKSSGQTPLWERLISTTSIHIVDGWKYIAAFANEQSIIIFFDTDRDSSAVLLENGFHLTDILAECTGFVFYVTNESYDYLISFNDHDVLIGAGTAKEWVSSLKAVG